MKQNSKRILNISILTAIVTAATLNVSFADTVYSKQILSEAEKSEQAMEQVKPNFVNVGSNALGDDFYKQEIKTNREEFHFKNIKDFLDEKKPKAQVNNEVETKKEADMQIFCDEMEYFEDRNELEARGGVEIVTPDGVKVVADSAVYNKQNNTIKLLNNIVLTKESTTVTGDYMLIDLNEENALMEDPVTRMGELIINAKEGYAYSDRIENINGNIELNKVVEMQLKSQGFTKYGRSINDTRLVDFDLKKQRSKPYKFRTKEIIIRPEKDHDSMLLKDVDIYYEKRKIANVPSIEFFTDKEMTYSEVNFPVEIGSLKGFGLYYGMGYTFKLPSSTFRVTPAIVYGNSKLGAGLIGQYKTKKTRLEAGWSTSTTDLIVDGQFAITDKLKFDIGRHVYKSEWFNGGTRAGYLGELSYQDAYLVEDLGNAVFKHKFSAGYVADYKKEHQEDDMQDGFRYRYMAEMAKSIKRFGSVEKASFIDISAVAQGMATVYSETGDVFGMFRVGPRVSSKLGRWNSAIQYTMGGVHGKSPYMFDEYRYGKHTIHFDESLILNRYVSLGYRGAITPLKDNYDEDILTENRFYFVVGPEDFKVAFSYDTIRQNMHFDFLLLLGSDNLDLRYEKMTVNNPEKLGERQTKMSDKELNKITVPENL